MTKLVSPSIPVHFIQDLFANCGGECLQVRLREGSTSPALVTLLSTIQWANELKAECDYHKGQITAESDKWAVEKMLEGFRAMAILDFLE